MARAHREAVAEGWESICGLPAWGASDLGFEPRTMGRGRAPLVLGECVQGQRADGIHFLITSPINLYSTAQFVPDLELGRLVADPEDRTKSLLAVARYLNEQNLPPCGTLRVWTPMSPSHGFGTSSADITASIRAAADAWGRSVTPETISRIAISIEPTDGSMYGGSVAYAHRQGKLLERIGQLPGYSAIAVYGDGAIDTVEFDKQRRNHRYSQHEIDQLQQAWDMVRRAARLRRLDLMTQACGLSASINQRLLPKPLFAELRRFVEIGMADGLMAAHSGSILALLLDTCDPDHRRRQERLAREVEGVSRRWISVFNHEEKRHEIPCR